MSEEVFSVEVAGITEQDVYTSCIDSGEVMRANEHTPPKPVATETLVAPGDGGCGGNA